MSITDVFVVASVRADRGRVNFFQWVAGFFLYYVAVWAFFYFIEHILPYMFLIAVWLLIKRSRG